MTIIRLAIAIVLAAFMIFMGLQKFGAHNPVFAYMAWQSGIGLFEPGIRILTGVGELASGVLILASLRVSLLKGLGGLLAFGLIAGAVVFHLSPWLGVVAPVAFTDSASAPFNALSDYERSIGLFITALIFLAITLAHLFFERAALQRFIKR